MTKTLAKTLTNTPIFSFAILTDTHIRPPQGDNSSPYAVNELANSRARYASQLIAAQMPAFTIHLGDMVHTLPHLSTYSDACQEAHRIFEPLKKQGLYFVAGNHDIGDKRMASSAAGPVDDITMSSYQKHFGESWYSFEHDDCLFVTINSSLVNSATQAEIEQKEWLELTLNTSSKNTTTKQRIFLFSHYPPFINTKDEATHYDNYDEPGRSWLLELIERYNIEAIFSGHVHHFFYNRLAKSKFYCLAATSFTRQDYSELFRANPLAEFGRDDLGKFSIAIVDVFKDNHKLRIIPTDGSLLKAHEEFDSKTQPHSQPRQNNVTVHLRHPWFEENELPYNGPMEEFSRKRVRNDYSLLRLWQLGITKGRTPLADLKDSKSRQRMYDYASTGIRFSVFTTSLGQAEWELLADHKELLDSVELVTASGELEQNIIELQQLKPLDLKLYLSKSHSASDENQQGSKQQGSKFVHNVSSGFLLKEKEALIDSLKALDALSTIDGLVFQINLDDDLKQVSALDTWFSKHNLNVILNVKLANKNPSVPTFDETIISERLNELLSYEATLNNTSFQLDTFMDIDRGYNPRYGLIDRYFNFRKAAYVFMR